MNNSTCHSEYLNIKSIGLKPLRFAFKSESHIQSQWEELNYLSKPNLKQAINEYAQFENYIKENSLKIHYFPEDENSMLDSIYCRDASIATDYGMIICSMGKDGRIMEPAAHQKAYIEMGIEVLAIIEPPGTIEGGDVCWIDQHTLVVGHSYRTNLEGIRQLKQILEPKEIEVIKVDLPHYKGIQDVFHLMSILSPIDKNLAVVYSPLMPISLRNMLLDRGFELVEVPESEFESMGCNVLAVAPRKCLMVEGNPITQERLILTGCDLTTYKGEEISVKGGGGPTCLTRPFERIY